MCFLKFKYSVQGAPLEEPQVSYATYYVTLCLPVAENWVIFLMVRSQSPELLSLLVPLGFQVCFAERASQEGSSTTLPPSSGSIA